MPAQSVEQVELTTTIVTTTLFDLIATLSAKSDQHEDDRITATIMDLIRTGRLTFLRDQAPADQYEMRSRARQPDLVYG